MLYGIDEGQKKKVNVKLIVFACLTVALVVGVILVIRYFSTRTLKNYVVVSQAERADSNNVTYLPFKNSILKYSKDGVSLINESGKSTWNGGYEMDKPVVDTCEDYVVVTDAGAKKFFVGSVTGKESGVTFQTDYPVSRCKVAGTGEVLALLHDEDSDNLCIYNVFEDNPLEIEIPSNIDESGYTLDFDISPDGKCVVVAYLAVKNGHMENKVCFYNFGDDIKDSSHMVGGASFSDTGIGQIKFLDNEKVAVFTENGFSVFSDMNKPTEKNKVTLPNAPKSVAVSDENILLVTGSIEDGNQKLHLYDTSGNQSFEMPISVVYSNVMISGEDIIFTDEQTCDIFRTNGSKKFHYRFDQVFEYFFPAVEGNHYYFVDSSTIKKIKVKN
ncbi:MAG: DUF5711 family protein [Eubacterium sp.]|nr:DUF5711 family protein [Eubacterium sp.]